MCCARLSHALHEKINSVIGRFVDIRFPLFPLQCFPVGSSRQFSVSFGVDRKQLYQGDCHFAVLLLYVVDTEPKLVCV